MSGERERQRERETEENRKRERKKNNRERETVKQQRERERERPPHDQHMAVNAASTRHHDRLKTLLREVGEERRRA